MLVVPSPKFQAHVVTDPVVVLAKATLNGATPLAGTCAEVHHGRGERDKHADFVREATFDFRWVVGRHRAEERRTLLEGTDDVRIRIANVYPRRIIFARGTTVEYEAGSARRSIVPAEAHLSCIRLGLHQPVWNQGYHKG